MMKNKSNVNEFDHMKKMLKKIHLIKEQTDPQYQNALNSNFSQTKENEQSEDYNIDGGKITIYSQNGASLDLSDDIRNSFTASMDEFKQQISDLVEFNSLQLHDNSLQWSGKLSKFDLEFFYLIGDKNGVYIKGEKIKVDEEFTTMLNQLTQYYGSFAQKWSPILSSRQQAQGNEKEI
jgi:hypothetical protein